MAEDGKQLTFADARKSHPSPFEGVRATPEKRLNSIPVNEGASLYTGPLSSPYHQFVMHVPDGATCIVRNSRAEDGDISLSVEFESPPEMAGKVGWLSRIKGSTKFK